MLLARWLQPANRVDRATSGLLAIHAARDEVVGGEIEMGLQLVGELGVTATTLQHGQAALPRLTQCVPHSAPPGLARTRPIMLAMRCHCAVSRASAARPRGASE